MTYKTGSLRGAAPLFQTKTPSPKRLSEELHDDPFGEGDKGGEVKHHSALIFFVPINRDSRMTKTKWIMTSFLVLKLLIRV
jgi:hypothetical protein